MDPDADDISPWMRDDWTGTETPRLDVLSSPARSAESSGHRATPSGDPEDALPGPEVQPLGDRTASEAGDRHPPVSSRRRGQRIAGVAVVATVLAVVLAVVGAVLVRGDDPAEPADAAPVVDESRPPVDTVAAAVPGTVLDAVSAELAARSAAEERAAAGAVARSGAAGGLTPAVAVAGEVPAWTEWTIELGAPISRIDSATEVVMLTSGGVLHLLELPTGDVRSIVVPEPNRDWKLAVSDAAVVVYDQRDVVVIRDDRPVQRLQTPESLLFVQPWPSTSSFIATMTASPALDADRIVLDVDTGATRPLSAEIADALRFGAASFLASGELVVDRAGGIYAIGIDGQARRLDAGGLLAVGRHHYGIETCDEALQCADVVVDVRTGERTPAQLAGLAPGGFVDPSSHMSPDGRSVVFTDATRGTGFRQILDAASGQRVDIGRLRGIFTPDTWAADSSGVFTLDDGTVRFQTRGAVELARLDAVRGVDALAVRPG
ncbi:MAG TPA: hypothetical protein VK853_06495 [Ilumatobacteraceae bacterium]|nr:hypothetical protein [Ilumatobacteraceae bacterium]